MSVEINRADKTQDWGSNSQGIYTNQEHPHSSAQQRLHQRKNSYKDRCYKPATSVKQIFLEHNDLWNRVAGL